MIKLIPNIHDRDMIDVITEHGDPDVGNESLVLVWASVNVDLFFGLGEGTIYRDLRGGYPVDCVVLTKEEHEELKGRDRD